MKTSMKVVDGAYPNIGAVINKDVKTVKYFVRTKSYSFLQNTVHEYAGKKFAVSPNGQRWGNGPGAYPFDTFSEAKHHADKYLNCVVCDSNAGEVRQEQ